MQIDDKSKHLLLREIGLNIFKQTENQKFSIHQKETDQVFVCWPLILPKTDISFVVLFNHQNTEREICLKLSLGICPLIKGKPSIIENYIVKGGDYFVIPIISHLIDQSKGSYDVDITKTDAHEKQTICVEINAEEPNSKFILISNLDQQTTLQSLLSILESHKTDDVYYEYVL